jgi:peptide/nickel transport system permease protein
MLNILGRRLLGAIPVLAILALVVFILQKVAPVDPVAAFVGEKASPEVYARAREQLGLNDPVPVQYLRYLGHMLQGNLGQSSVTRTSVAADIAKFLPVTMELVLVAFIMIIIAGFYLGLATAQGWRGSGVLRVVMISGASLPVFLTSLLAMLVFFRWLNWLPATGQTSYYDAPTGPTGFLLVDSLLSGQFPLFVDDLRHLLLPAACVAIPPAVSVGRVLRSSLQESMRSDCARTARAKGLSEKQILTKHALRNSLGPALALSGLQLGSLFGSSIVVELIFARPGIGLYMAQAINKGDFNTIAGTAMVLGLLYVVANTLVDLCQAAADPRIRV